MNKNLQYIVSGALVLYIVFFTRPAPTAIVNLLASPVSQLAALGVVVYLGASVSLLVAVVAALAVVLSIPAREYAGKADDKTMKEKEKEKSKDKKKTNPVADAASDLSKKAVSASKKKTAVPPPADDAPEPAGDKAAAEPATKGSEGFCLQNAAAF